MYGIITYIWLMFMAMVNIGKSTIHGWYGLLLKDSNTVKFKGIRNTFDCTWPKTIENSCGWKLFILVHVLVCLPLFGGS